MHLRQHDFLPRRPSKPSTASFTELSSVFSNHLALTDPRSHISATSNSDTVANTAVLATANDDNEAGSTIILGESRNMRMKHEIRGVGAWAAQETGFDYMKEVKVEGEKGSQEKDIALEDFHVA